MTFCMYTDMSEKIEDEAAPSSSPSRSPSSFSTGFKLYLVSPGAERVLQPDMHVRVCFAV